MTIPSLTLALIPSAAAVLADVAASRDVEFVTPDGITRSVTLRRVRHADTLDGTMVTVSDTIGEWDIQFPWLAHAHAEGMYGHAR